MPTLLRPTHRRPAPAARARTAVVTLAALLAVSGCGVLGGGGGAPGDEVSATGEDGSGVGLRGADDPAATPSPDPGSAAALPTFDPDTAVGGYAPGFPEKLLGAPQDATVLASSATPDKGSLTDVTLNLSTPRSTQEVIDQLAKRLRKAGFTESESGTFTGLTAQTTFGRETTPGKKKGARDSDPVMESVTVGVLDDGERRLVTVSGSVVVG
ncbi:hypothetical protein [Isoptericola sp. NPDC055881]